MDSQNSHPGTPHHDTQFQNPLEFWPPSRTNFGVTPEDFSFQATVSEQEWFLGSTKIPASNSSFLPPRKAYPPLQQTGISNRHPIQQVRAQAGTSRPSTKRQKIEPRIRLDEQDHIERCLSQSGAKSTCCSSCPDSPPCVEPDCSLVVPCTDKSCAVPVCTDPCLEIGPQAILDQTRRLTNWNDSVWTPQTPRASSQNGENIGNLIDPSLGGFDRVEYPHGESPYSNAPSMVHNDVPTPYSPHTSHATPQSAIYQSQQTYDNDILSGAGTMFQPPFNGNTFGSAQNNNGSFTFSCRWDGCDSTTFPSLDDWLPHLHKEHLDPQLTFHCPIQEENCATDIEFNGLFGHLEDTHGYNFMNEESFSCPAPDCDPAETYCDPSLLHNHFDYVHATPTKGTLQCRVDSCNTGFADPGQLSCHLNDVHKLPISLPSNQDIDLTLPPTVSKNTFGQRQSSLPNNDSISSIQPGSGAPDQALAHTCKWLHSFCVCGRVCSSEAELQTHVTNEHLNSLDKGTGYNCHWQGCGRHTKRGEKSGFSQRGKLERHMATHTGYKCAKCDICGKTFSAEQSMKQHRLLHTGDRPWKCKYCDRSFPQQSACTIHERTHTGDKPLSCNICGKKFSESSNLSKHRKIHGEKGLHSCSYEGCTKSFHRLDQLKRHRLVHTRAEGKSGKYDAGSESESGITRTDSELGSE